MNVLILDDQQAVLDGLKNGIEWKKNGVSRLFLANSIDDARRIFQQEEIHILFCDIEMPGENGPDVFKILRAMPNVQDTPIVFLTGVSDRKKIQEVLSLKPQGYVLKPINMDKLFSTIYGLLR